MNPLRFLRRRKSTFARKTRRPEVLNLVSDLWLENKRPASRWSWPAFWITLTITSLVLVYLIGLWQIFKL